MDLRQLEFVVNTLETGSFSKTAQSCFTTQQTVSSSIRALEFELGIQLFTRTHAGVELRGDCEPFYKKAEEALDCIRSLKETAEGLRVGQGKLIDIAIPYCLLSPTSGVINYADIDYLQAFVGNRAIHIHETSSINCIDEVRKGISDICLVIGNPQSKELECLLVSSFRCQVMISVQNPLSQKETISFADLRNELIAAPPDRGYSLELISDQCRKNGFEPHIESTSEQLSSIFENVYSDRNIAFIVNEHWNLVDTNRAKLIPLCKHDDFNLPIYLAWRSDSDTEAIARTLHQRITAL